MRKVILLLTLVLLCGYSYSQTDFTKLAEIRKIILKESKEGGKYDFFTSIKDHEYDGVQIKPGLYDTKLGLALIKWGKINYELGIIKLEEAYDIFSEFKEKKINQREKDYIKIGFNRELEK